MLDWPYKEYPSPYINTKNIVQDLLHYQQNLSYTFSYKLTLMSITLVL